MSMDPSTQVKYEKLRIIAQQFKLENVPTTDHQKVVDVTTKYIASTRKKDMLWTLSEYMIQTGVSLAVACIWPSMMQNKNYWICYGITSALILGPCIWNTMIHTACIKALNFHSASNENKSKIIQLYLYNNLNSGNINHILPFSINRDKLNNVKFVKRELCDKTKQLSFSPEHWNKSFAQAIHDAGNFAEVMSGKCDGFQFVVIEE